ncbi:hypothetical protein JCM10212_004314, partial [Sporobolomyces blumeae]
ANGFFGSRGVSRFIPPAYTHFSHEFYNEIVDRARRKRQVAQVTRREDEGDDEEQGARNRSRSVEDAIRVEMSEWKKEGWTYHAKGIWLTPSLSSARSALPLNASPLSDANDLDAYLHSLLVPLPPFLTLIGSSNYGSRSATRDLEANVLVTTQGRGLRKRLEQELARIRNDARDKVDARLFEREDRKVPWGVKVAAKAIESML